MTSTSYNIDYAPPWISEVKLPKDWHILLNEDGSGSIVDRAGNEQVFFDYGVPEVDVIGAYDPHDPSVDGWIAHLVNQKLSFIAEAQSKRSEDRKAVDPKTLEADHIIPPIDSSKDEQTASIPIPDQRTQACITSTLAADAKAPIASANPSKAAERARGETR